MAVLAKESVADLQRMIQNKAELYEAAIRNGWYLPKFKSSIITEVYINAVIQGVWWCPKFSEIRLLPCPRPPQK